MSPDALHNGNTPPHSRNGKVTLLDGYARDGITSRYLSCESRALELTWGKRAGEWEQGTLTALSLSPYIYGQIFDRYAT